MTWLLVLGMVAVFGALLLLGLDLAGRQRVKRRRLSVELGVKQRDSATTRATALGTQATMLAGRALDHYDKQGRLASALERGGIGLRPAEFLALVATGMTIAMLATLAFAGIVVALMVGVLAGVCLQLVVTARAKKRQHAFEEQLPDALQVLAGGLRTGHSLTQAIDGLADEADSPTREEFARVLFETRLGHSLPAAMHKVAGRMQSDDFDEVAEAVEIQMTVGGDLAELLDGVGETIRERRRIQRTIKSLTAEGRLSAIILFCLPVAMFAFISVANKEYLEELTGTTGGLIVLAIAGGFMIVGGLWSRYIVRMKY
jgi:tight adherence protein B